MHIKKPYLLTNKACLQKTESNASIITETTKIKTQKLKNVISFTGICIQKLGKAIDCLFALRFANKHPIDKYNKYPDIKGRANCHKRNRSSIKLGGAHKEKKANNPQKKQ